MDKIEPENGNEDPMNSDSKDMPSDWRFGNAYSANISIGMVPTGNAMVASNADLMESSSCSSASMVGSFCPPIWNQAANSRHLGFCDINVENNASTSHTSGISGLGPPRTGIERALDMGWTPPISLLKGGMFLPTVPGMLPQSLSQFPADSGFIERAARFSCFSGGNSGDMMNPFGLPDSMNSYFRVAAPLQWPQQSFAGRASKSISSLQAQEIEINRAQNSEDVNMSADHAAIEGSPLKNEKKSDSLVTSHGETKQTAGVPVNESDVAEFSTGPGQDKTAMLDGACGGPSSEQGNGTKKRKGSVQDTELHQLKGFQKPVSEATKDNNEIQKGDQNQASSVSKPLGKHGKQGSQASDSPKEEYIHVRARRGQATNSHSLAERVRREKISERMKFLQDLVPGCSKVTGKAVMLDEIINYVQSLQRQVEFLSMKLATVNPRLDFNIEGLLAKDMLQSHPGPSSSLVFPPDMTIPYPPLCPSQPGLIQGGFPGMGNSSDALQRSITSQLTAMSRGYKEPTSQVPNVWEDELHNVVQMGFNPATPINTQDLSGPLRPGHMKPEL